MLRLTDFVGALGTDRLLELDASRFPRTAQSKRGCVTRDQFLERDRNYFGTRLRGRLMFLC